MPLMDAPGDEIIEYICQENERDANHLDNIKLDFDKKAKSNKK